MPPAALPVFRPLFLAAALVCSPALLARTASADPAAPADKAAAVDLQLSADGNEVRDLRARLVWPRCVHGMVWRNDRCLGTPQRLGHAQAQKLAQSRHQSDGLRWRLPRSNELRRLRQRAVSPAGQAARLFPAVPGEWHWTGSAAVNARAVNRYSYEQTGPARSTLSAQQAWAVDWATGAANGEMGRGNALLVRLVRPLSADELLLTTP